MSQTKHTAGPWTTERVTSGDTLVYARIGPIGKRSIAYAGVYGTRKGNARISDEEAEANARLIAAAPEMASLLERWLDALSDMTTDAFSNGADKPFREDASQLLARIRGAA